MIELLLTAAFLAALVLVVYLLRRLPGTDRALLKQNRDLHDQIIAMTEERRDWLEHRREMERRVSERQALRRATTPEPAAVWPPAFTGQNPMELAEPDDGGRDVRMPAHGELETGGA